MRELERSTPSRPDTDALTPIVVIGPGRVGRAIARAASDGGLDFTLAGRSDALAACEGAAAALLCVPDAEIARASATIAAARPPLRFVGHTSGATGLDAIAATSAAGTAAFSLHPLQTVPDGSTTLAGAPAAISATDPEALAFARSLAEAIGMTPFELADGDRALYHAAASIASNFLVALEESAAELLADAGIERPRELLTPLVLRSAANWAERGADALTGPIARGDEGTVARHLDELAERSPQLLELYRTLAERTRRIAEARPGASR